MNRRRHCMSINFFFFLFHFFSFRCHVDIRCCERHFAHILAIVLCRCHWGSNAWDSHHDSDSTLNTSASGTGNFLGNEFYMLNNWHANDRHLIFSPLLSCPCSICAFRTYLHWLIMLVLPHGCPSVVLFSVYPCKFINFNSPDSIRDMLYVVP